MRPSRKAVEAAAEAVSARTGGDEAVDVGQSHHVTHEADRSVDLREEPTGGHEKSPYADYYQALGWSGNTAPPEHHHVARRSRAITAGETTERHEEEGDVVRGAAMGEPTKTPRTMSASELLAFIREQQEAAEAVEGTEE